MRSGSTSQAGFTLIAVMAAMLLLALGTQGVMMVLSQQAQREREAQLLRIGTEIAAAIAAYHAASPGTVKVFPRSLEDLLDDKRFVSTKRHLRRVYADPITNSTDWGILRRADGTIEGVYSKSEATPVRTAGIELHGIAAAGAQKYSDWKFAFTPREATP